MGKKDLGVKHFGNVLMLSELGSVVGGDGTDVLFERSEQLNDDFGYGCGVLALRRFGHKHFLGGALDECDDNSLAVAANDSVHFSLLTVDLLTSISFAISGIDIIFFKHTEIVYLCSLVRWLYFFIFTTQM